MTQTPRIVVLEKRMVDYRASLKDNPGIWGCGKTPDAAVGNLVDAHRDAFEIPASRPELRGFRNDADFGRRICAHQDQFNITVYYQ